MVKRLFKVTQKYDIHVEEDIYVWADSGYHAMNRIMSDDIDDWSAPEEIGSTSPKIDWSTFGEDKNAGVREDRFEEFDQ